MVQWNLIFLVIFIVIVNQLLSQSPEVLQVTQQSLQWSVHIVVFDAEFFTSLYDDGSDLLVVWLDYPREQMMGSLMV